ncbi:hypothetical protein [Salinispora arenicola]|uniref:hypothetical protein n=1 Tax=Salinispora arenicola TaxID=168697 RepID=UPI00036B1BBC|nr:hypothetical protein [Salinispora arenicola]
MNDQRHDHEPDRPGARRARSRWWNVGLAGMTGLALTTSLGIGGVPATGAVDRNLTATDDRPGKPDQASTDNKDHEGKGKKDTRTGTPVPCSADALIAAITLGNARGGAVLDLASKCTYLLTADIDDGAGLPEITAPITLNGGTHTSITRAAAAPLFRILTVEAGGNLTLNHLTITGGQTTDNGGGILVNTGGTLATKHSTIIRNIAGGSGGGILSLGNTSIDSSTISYNSAIIDGGGINSQRQIYLTNSLIVNNQTSINSGGGAAIVGSAAIAKTAITGNGAGNAGGGLVIFAAAATITDSRIVDNVSANNGGGISVPDGAQLTLRRVAVADNRAGGTGGGLFVNLNNQVVAEDARFERNTATGDGGGISNLSDTVVRRSKLSDNQADEGAGVFNGATATLTLYSTKVVKNTAVTDGGGIFNEAGGTVELNTATGTVVVKNRPNNCVNVPGCPG